MKIYRYLLLPLLLLGSACNDWFDAPSESGNINEEQLFADEDAYLNSLAGIYTLLRSNTLYGEHLSVSALEFLAQHYIPDNTETEALATYDYSATTSQAIIRNIWRDMYHAIATCNKTLEHILSTEIPFSHTGQKEIITGELYALRGALHFELLRMFHPSPTAGPGFKGMPYMTKFSTESSAPQSTEEILQAAASDLQKASTLLYGRDPLFRANKDYSSQAGELNRELRTFHLNYYAVTALLARLYLYKGEYEKAYNYADSTFGHIRKVESSHQVFYYYGPGQYVDDKSFSREHIFGISSTKEGLTSVSQELFETRRINACQDFTNIYPSTDDTRRREWFQSIHVEEGVYTMSGKYSESSVLNGYIPDENGDKQLPVRIPFIKLGEASLIAAEALNELGRTEEAAQWLIELQEKRNITFVKDLQSAGLLTRDALLQEIRAEYEREFFGEGQAFFFHKRMNDKQLKRYDGTIIDMPAEDYTFPIPADGLSAIHF